MKNALCLTAKISLHSVHFTLKGKILYVVFVVKSKMLLSFFFTILKTYIFFYRIAVHSDYLDSIDCNL